MCKNVSLAICSIISELYLRWVMDQTQTKNMFHQIQALITKEKEMRTKVNTNLNLNLNV